MVLCALSSDNLLTSYNQPVLVRQASTYLPGPLPQRSTDTRASQQAKLPAIRLILLTDSPIRIQSLSIVVVVVSVQITLCPTSSWS
jgi:hypothetical protein